MGVVVRNKKPEKRQAGYVLLACLLLAAALLAGWMVRNSGNVRPQDLITANFILSPNFSHATGFYEHPVEVKLFNPNPDSKIYYTLDGSEPDITSTPYTGPIRISSTTAKLPGLSLIPTSPVWQPPLQEVYHGVVLKAVAVRKGYKSRVSAATYFIDAQGRARYSLPVMVLTVDPDDFFSPERGIYVRGRTYEDKDYYIKTKKQVEQGKWWYYPANYTRRGMDWERPVIISYLEAGENAGLNTRAGVRIHGNSSRGYQQKSLKVHFRKRYGPAELNYDFFNGKGATTLRSFVLRNSGQDLTSTMFRDAVTQEMFKGTSLDRQAYQPTVLFINGEYWGIHNIREFIDPHFLGLKHELTPDSISILVGIGLLNYGQPGDEIPYFALKSFAASHDLSVERNYQYVASKMDVDNFMEYLISEMFIANEDWPHNNMKMWRYKGVPQVHNPLADGRWRWILYDTDPGMGRNYSVNSQSVQYVLKSPVLGPLFGALLNNPDFKANFIARFRQQLQTNLQQDSVIMLIDQMQAVIAPEMKEHIRRWRAIPSYEAWQKNVAGMRDFARRRPAIMLQQLKALEADTNRAAIMN